MPMNITDKISIRILAAIAEAPEREYYQREIAKLAGISIGATSQKLRKLAGDGLVTYRKSGRMMFYRYNLRDPAAKQLKILLNVNAVHGMIQELKDRARRVILFGSCAEGTNVKSSDIDLLVLTEDSKEAREIVSNYGDKLGRKISPVVVNANEFRQLRSKDRPLYERINKGIVLWEAQ
jgi:predicted nucleotidyltransferase